ncbi:MAG: hypothetical protein ACYC1M_18315 [Armatimonadota bacterium]
MRKRINIVLIGLGFLGVMYCSLRVNLNPAVDDSYIVALTSTRAGSVFTNRDNHARIYDNGFIYGALGYMKPHELALYEPQTGKYQSSDHILLGETQYNSRYYPSKAHLEVVNAQGTATYTMRLSVDELMAKRWVYRIDENGVHNIREFTFYWMPFISTLVWWFFMTVLLLVINRDRGKTKVVK